MSMRAAPMATVKCKQKLGGGGSSLEQGIVNREEDTQVMSMGVAAAEFTEGEMTRRCAQSNGTSEHQCEEVCYRKPTLAESGRGGLLEGSEEQNNELNVETNFTVSNCREHHGQQHHCDSLHGRHGHVPQGEGLKEWKGGFVEGDRQYELEGESSQPQKFEEGNGGLYSERSNPARVGLGQGGSESGKLLNACPTSAPRRMQGVAASGERVKFPKGERIDINISNGRNRSAMGTYKSRGVKGVKEDCDRFRHQMQVLKEKAEDSRVREVEVEGMVDRLQKCTVDEIDTVATRKGVGVRGEPPKSHRTARFSNKERLEFENIYTSPRISPTQNGALGCKLNISPPPPPHLHGRPLLRWEPEVMKDAHKEFEARKTIPALTACLPSYTNSTSSSSSGSSMSSLPSLPLSHYIQKLKHLAPKSHLPASSRALYTPGSNTAAAMVGCCNPAHTALHHNILTSSASTLEPQSKYEPSTSDYKPSPESLDTSSNRRVGDSEWDSSHLSSNKSTAILLPTSTANAHTANCPLAQSQYNNDNSRFGICAASQSVSRSPLSDTTSCQMVRTEQQMGGVLGCCTLATSHLQCHHNNNINDFNCTATKFSQAKVGQKYLVAPDDLSFRGFNNRISEGVQLEAYEEKMAKIQRLVGEVKGSVEGFKIRIEVESEGWRGRMEGLEKELEALKDEMDDELLETKHSIRNEVKLKITDMMTDAEKMRRQDKEQVESLLEETIEKRFNEKDMGMAEMRGEIRLLWAEVEALSKGREEVQSHVQHLAQVAQIAKENANHEQDMLKSENGFLRRQLQTLKQEGIQVKLESEDFAAVQADFKHSVTNLTNEGSSMKLEIQSLKNAERVMKVEIENLQKLVEKMQEETEELEKERGISQIEGVRERLLIMERVESLSQLYLGGLEEVRNDVFNVKITSRDRLDEIESQWSEYKRHQENSSEDGPSSGSRQLLCNELENVRTEMAEIVETERRLLGESLERESGCIRDQVMELCSKNKSEMISMLKVEVQKRLQTARDKVLLMTDALKQEMDRLKSQLSEAQEGAEELAHAVSMVEREKDVAAAAAADATMFAAKAEEILSEMLGSFTTEMANARCKSVQLQENLAIERDFAAAAASEARRMSQELAKEKEYALIAVTEAGEKNQKLQEFLERESSKIMHAVAVVQQEKDAASHAASEATSSALKAGEMLSEVLNSFNTEMAKARTMSLQLQVGLEREREGLEREREVAIQHSQQAQDRFSQELELAIAGWKRAMNAEVAKAKEVCEGLEEEKRRVSTALEQASLASSLDHTMIRHQVQRDMDCYTSKTEAALSNLSQTVNQIQAFHDQYNEEKNQHAMLKLQETQEQDRNWRAELHELNEMVLMLERRVNDSEAEQSNIEEKIKNLEGMQINLVHSFKEVQTSTSDLEKTAAVRIPKYEAVSSRVNELSSKVEQMDKRFQGIGYGETLIQQVARVAESKVCSSSSLKEISSKIKDLCERVNDVDRTHCEAVELLENRVNQLESSVGHPDGLSLELDSMKKSDGEQIAIDQSQQSMGSLRQSIEALQRKVDMITADCNDPLGRDQVVNSRLVGLENRVEHVASATFTNLRLLDGKVEHITVGVQSALEGAAMAESKCGALGAELVKVFRMLTSCNQYSPLQQTHDQHSLPTKCGRRGQSHSPPVRAGEHHRLDSHSQSPISRNGGCPTSPPKANNQSQISMIQPRPGNISPNQADRAINRKGLRGPGRETVFVKGTQSSQVRKVTLQREKEKGEGQYSCASEEGGSPTKERWCHLRNPSREIDREKSGKDCKSQGQVLSIVDKGRPVGGGEPGLDGHLKIEKRQEGSAKNCQRTNIRLEAGRIHVNVSHRSAVANQSEKRGDLIAVQT
ncbi:unnamed protein product [Sphagnum compactum]